MKAGFYTIMAAQFFSSLADNALLIAAIRLLQELQEPEWMLPSLQQSFVVSYVDAGAAGRRVRRFDAQGPRDADHQRDQGRRLRADAVLRASAAGLRRGGLRRRGLFAGQIRNPHRAPAAEPAGRGQWLDRGNHGRLDHPRRAAGRPAGQPQRVARAAGLRHARPSTPASTTPPEAAISSSRCCTSSPPSSTGSFRTPASITACRARIRST